MRRGMKECSVSWGRIGRNWIIVKIAQFLPPGDLKTALLRHIGVHIGKNTFIAPDVVIDPVRPDMIVIEDNVFIGWGARLFTHVLEPGENGHRCTVGPIHIYEGAFVGGYTTIRPNVSIGQHAFIGSDSLVIDNVPPRAKAYGVPARLH